MKRNGTSQKKRNSYGVTTKFQTLLLQTGSKVLDEHGVTREQLQGINEERYFSEVISKAVKEIVEAHKDPLELIVFKWRQFWRERCSRIIRVIPDIPFPNISSQRYRQVKKEKNFPELVFVPKVKSEDFFLSIFLEEEVDDFEFTDSFLSGWFWLETKLDLDNKDNFASFSESRPEAWIEDIGQKAFFLPTVSILLTLEAFTSRSGYIFLSLENNKGSHPSLNRLAQPGGNAFKSKEWTGTYVLTKKNITQGNLIVTMEREVGGLFSPDYRLPNCENEVCYWRRCWHV